VVVTLKTIIWFCAELYANLCDQTSFVLSEESSRNDNY